MDRRGGCCIARFQNGNVYHMSKVDRIMLKFRPIAPKPVSGSPTRTNEQTSSKSGRGKRKYNKENNTKQKRNNTRMQKANSEKKNNIINMRKKVNSEEAELTRKTSSDSVVTLSLLPETPERKETVTVREEKSESPLWLSFAPSDGGHVEKETAVMTPRPIKAVTSIVTVECVTDTWLDGNLILGCNDREKMVNLGKDTCPGFISDGVDRVRWTNRAFGKMVGSKEVIVWLVMKEKVLITRDTFSCRVRVQSTCREGKGVTTVTYPCDVWRMDGGGFAWRLDVEAALSLGFRV